MQQDAPLHRRSVVVVLVLVASSLVIAYLWRLSEQRALDEATRSALRDVAAEISIRMDESVRALVRFSRQWESDPGTRSQWEAQARRLVADFQYVQAIEWVDAAMGVRWIVPPEGNKAAVGLDLGFEELRRSALLQARETGTAAATDTIHLVQGGIGFLFIVPLPPRDSFDGYLVAAYRASGLFHIALLNVAQGFSISIRDAEDELYERGAPSSLQAHAQSMAIEVHGLHWTATVAPGPDVVATHLTWLPGIVILGGTVNAIFFGLAVQLGHRSRLRAAKLFESNIRLSEEFAARERAQTELHDAREELAWVLRSLPDHVWSAQVGGDGAFITRYFSPVIQEISGHPSAWFEADPTRWIGIADPADQERVRESYRRCIEGGLHKHALEYRIRRPDGEIRWVHDRLTAERTPDGMRLHGVISDITEAKRAEQARIALEASLGDAQKLESLGVLTGGVAHDFNNLLTGVLGNAHLALEDLPEDSPVRPRIDRIVRAARAAADLCRQMLAYAGKGTVVAENLDLSEVVEGIGELLAASTARRIAIRYDLVRNAPPIRADVSQIRQVVMNLITNASEAIGDRVGTIEVTTRSVELDAADAGNDVPPGPQLELRVSDDGEGMDEETRRRIFEPFFTRKFTGRGLGMAAVHGIVKAHGGTISVASARGRGTTVTVRFPALPGETASPQTRVATGSSWSGSGTILLIDDESDAREVGLQVLERAGFRVLPAASGAEGIEVFEAHADEIVCVVLDLTMPGMGGLATFRRLEAIDPAVPVILSSGYPESAAVERFAEQGLAGFLEKPYVPSEMLERVREAVERWRPKAHGKSILSGPGV
jgi:PAS domain S-box-containing protein